MANNDTKNSLSGFGLVPVKQEGTGPERIRYTEDAIRRVFWRVFHERGEIFFTYGDNIDQNTEATTDYWHEFKDELERERRQ